MEAARCLSYINTSKRSQYVIHTICVRAVVEIQMDEYIVQRIFQYLIAKVIYEMTTLFFSLD